MYAVFRSGGKQYRASTGDVLRLEKIEAEEGATVEFDQVLLVGEGRDVKIGSPLLDGGLVSAKVLRQGKTRKVPVVKFRRRQNYLRQGSHRQFFTEVEITAIAGEGGSAATKKTAAKKAPAKKTTAKKTTAKKTAAKKTAVKKTAAKKTAAKKTAAKKASPKKAGGKDE